MSQNGVMMYKTTVVFEILSADQIVKFEPETSISADDIDAGEDVSGWSVISSATKSVEVANIDEIKHFLKKKYPNDNDQEIDEDAEELWNSEVESDGTLDLGDSA